MRPTAVGSAAAAAAAFLFGTVFVATAIQLRSFDPIAGALWRAVIAAAFLAPMVFIGFRQRQRSAEIGHTSTKKPMISRIWRGLVVGLCGGPLFVAGINLAVDGAGATVSAFVTGLYAVFAAFLAPLLLSEPLKRRLIAGLGAALFGTLLLSGLDLEPRFASGFLAGIGAALIYSFYLILGRRWSRDYGLPPEILTASSIASAIVVLFMWTVAVAPAALIPADMRLDAAVALMWVAMAWAVGQVLIMASVRRITAARSASFLLINPITAAFFGALLLGDILGPTQMLGGLLVLVGMAIAVEADVTLKTIPAWRAKRA